MRCKINTKLTLVLPQINIAAFVTKYDVPVGHASAAHDPEQPSVEVVSNKELMDHYEDFGSKIRAVMGCIDKPNKWYINVVYPHLKTYVRGKVALLGDAVRICSVRRIPPD